MGRAHQPRSSRRERTWHERQSEQKNAPDYTEGTSHMGIEIEHDGTESEALAEDEA